MKEQQPRFLTLEAWLAANYGNAVSIKTARRWVGECRIWPPPEKHGRSYYLERDARYIDPANPPADLKPTGRPYPLSVKAGFFEEVALVRRPVRATAKRPKREA